MNIIVDYGMGNLRSIANKLNRLGYSSLISSSQDDIAKATKLIIPGVGAFGTAMDNLKNMHLIPVIEARVIDENIPVLGICLGMQLMTRWSAEGNVNGFGWLDAVTLSLKERQSSAIVPHMGWNTISTRRDSSLTRDIPDNSEFYFVHSYYVTCNDPADVVAVTDHGGEFVSIVQKGNIFGTQFHPEKSHSYGITVLKNFMEYASC
jgi:imidazole glycerol-phosphate synthase subunit HisH